MTYRDPAPPEEPQPPADTSVRDTLKWHLWFIAFGLIAASFLVGWASWPVIFRVAMLGPAWGVAINGLAVLTTGRPPWRQL